MAEYHYVRTLQAFAHGDPERVLLATPQRTISARELFTNAAGLAGHLYRHGVTGGRPVATMLFNRPAIIESFYAALLLGSPPANVNPRYRAAEIAEVVGDCDAAVLIHEPGAGAEARQAAELLGRPLLLLEADSADYQHALSEEPAPPRQLSEQDQILWYTGGTTGRPRGVIWEVGTQYRMLWEVIKPGTEPPDPALLATGDARPAPTTMPCSPIAHGTAMGLALNALNGGGTVVLHEQASFDAAAALELVERHRVRVLGIVGDAFARPLLAALDAGGWNDRLKSLSVLSSSGAVWSPEVRERISAHLPWIRLIDNFGSTEALVSRDADGKGFQPRPGLVVLGVDNRPLPPGSAEVGVIATAGRLPLGYLNDPVKTAGTFREVEGVRYLVIGDEAAVNADGTIRILGRGSSCINTGGEKVWPEEVEIVVRDHPAITDAAIIGLPNEKWGQQVTAVIAVQSEVSDEELSAHCRARLTAYKCPREWIRVDTVPRTFVGKPDYQKITELAASARQN